jgi:capsular polysaccharide biosynthesis protein
VLNELSTLSFVEKMSQFAKADLIVSATGAGLANMLFCKPGTQVLEIFNDGIIVGPFYDIAA